MSSITCPKCESKEFSIKSSESINEFKITCLKCNYKFTRNGPINTKDCILKNVKIGNMFFKNACLDTIG